MKDRGFLGHASGGRPIIRAVLPPKKRVYAVDGASPDSFIGIGSALYKPGMDVAALCKRAGDIVSAYDGLKL